MLEECTGLQGRRHGWKDGRVQVVVKLYFASQFWAGPLLDFQKLVGSGPVRCSTYAGLQGKYASVTVCRLAAGHIFICIMQGYKPTHATANGNRKTRIWSLHLILTIYISCSISAVRRAHSSVVTSEVQEPKLSKVDPRVQWSLFVISNPGARVWIPSGG